MLNRVVMVGGQAVPYKDLVGSRVFYRQYHPMSGDYTGGEGTVLSVSKEDGTVEISGKYGPFTLRLDGLTHLDTTSGGKQPVSLARRGRFVVDGKQMTWKELEGHKVRYYQAYPMMHGEGS